MEGNNAPFAVGQKVIRTGRSIPGFLVKGEVYTVAYCRQCTKCNLWKVGILELPIPDNSSYRSTCTCGLILKPSPDKNYTGNAKLFAPIQHQYTDIAKEIADSYKSTEEVPDKIIIPEKVNN